MANVLINIYPSNMFLVMLLSARFRRYKNDAKKKAEPECSSVSTPMNTNMTRFRCFSEIVTFFLHWKKVASALEGLRFVCQSVTCVSLRRPPNDRLFRQCSEFGAICVTPQCSKLRVISFHTEKNIA